MPQIKAYFQGIDENKPMGVVVTVEGTEFRPLAFLPVTDLPTVMGNLEQQLGRASDAGDGVRELQGPQPMFLKEQAGWVFIAQTPQALKDLPQNPAQLLDGMDQQYDIGIRAYLSNVPAQFKQMIVGQLGSLVQNSMPNDPAGAEAQIQQLSQTINESDRVTIGWQIDPEKKETHFDVVSKPVAGTQMAKQAEAIRDAKSDFGGFLIEDAAIRGNMTSMILPEQMEQSLAGLKRIQESTQKEIAGDEDLDAGTRAAAQELIQTFFGIAESTIKTGKIDSCTSIILKPKTLTVLSAGHVADGTEVEAAVKKLVAASENQSEFSFSSVKFNAEQHAGVNLHTLALPIPADEYARKILGETLEITLGTAKDSAYVAVGADGMDYLKRHIDVSQNSPGQTVDPFSGELALTPILQFAESVEPNPILRSLTEMIRDQPDRLRMRASVNDADAVMYRLTLEEGVLSVLGQGLQMVGVNAGGQ